MRLIDEIHTEIPFYGSRKITYKLCQRGYLVNRKRVQRLMQKMGLQAIYPGPNTSKRRHDHKVYPYLLSDYLIVRPNQVWSTDITYIRMGSGFLYLVAVIDWYSRYVLSWQLSNTLDTYFCIESLNEALGQGQPEIFNTDQGCQFTSKAFTQCLLDKEIAISMDSKGRALDNIFVERLWRSVKYENIYINDYRSVTEVWKGLNKYFNFYNKERIHQSLDYQTPEKVHAVDKLSTEDCGY